MTIQFIDQVLNIAISSLVYGSEIWLAYAFSRFVATHELESLKQPAERKQRVSSTAATARLASPSQKEIKPPTIETEGTASRKTTAKKTAPRTKQPEARPAAISPVPQVRPPLQQPQITCEPVNWKKWKVNDLRRASIARACNVKSTPVGSRRKLTKADLIAQYEQNLKRMTKQPPARLQKQAQTA